MLLEEMPTVIDGEERTEMVDSKKRVDIACEERETWSNKLDFFLSCVGYCIGTGNIWRFPYLCYKNGGGAFLIPYLLMVVLCGIPMYFLELAAGQYHKAGVLGIWKENPAFKGVGYACLVVTGLCNIYYPLVMAWALWYFFHSFGTTLPWSSCDNHWNTDNCVETNKLNPYFNSSQTSFELGNLTKGDNFSHQTTSEEEFWTRHTVRVSGSINDLGEFHWQMALLLLLVWVLCYGCIWKGVKLSGKVVYVTAILPYVLLLVLTVRGATLPGALQGVQFYLSADIQRLTDSQVWVDAASQVFFSTGICYSAVVVLGSYNDLHHDVHKSAILVVTINGVTSFMAGFAIFSVLGFLANRLGVNVSDVADSGPGLAFIIYPTALSELPFAPFWACLFFLMLVLVGLDTQFCLLEGFFSSVIDEFPSILRKRRELFIAASCFVSYLIGLTMTTQAGIYVFQLLEWYAGSRISLLFIVFWESIAFGWFYGGDGFYKPIQEMIGYRPIRIFKICWRIIIPGICCSVFIFSLVKYAPVTYRGQAYPPWAETVGWLCTLSTIVSIPLIMFSRLLRKNIKRRFF